VEAAENVRDGEREEETHWGGKCREHVRTRPGETEEWGNNSATGGGE